MPSYTEIQKEVQKAQSKNAFDETRRAYLKILADATGRDTIIYAMADGQMIDGNDIQCFMAALYGLSNDNLDLIIHSGGGQSEATEQLVTYLRKKYKHIRAIIPLRAMSAATMLACSCNEIVMGKQSALGPIDPQFKLEPNKPMVPGHAILEDFDKALADVRNDPSTAAIWVPKLQNIPHGFLSMCRQTIDRSKKLVGAWLHAHVGLDQTKADEIAEWLAHYDHRSHGKPIDAEDARNHGLPIVDMEADHDLQDKILSVFHATMITLQSTPCVKMTENQNGKGLYVQNVQMQMMPGQPFPFPVPGARQPIPAGQRPPGVPQPQPGAPASPMLPQLPVAPTQPPSAPPAPQP